MKKSIRKFTLSILAATTGVLVASAAGVIGWALTQKNSQNKLTSITSSLNGSFDVVYHSQNVTVKQGEATTLVVSTTGDTSNLIYNWYVDKGDGEGYSIVQGGTKNTYLLDEGQTRNVSEITHWTYRCEIKNRFTVDTLTVEDIHVTIQPTSETFITIYDQPQANVTLESGATTTLSTRAVSSKVKESVVYQWFVDKGDKNGFQAIKGATQSSYTIPASQTTVSQQTVKKYLCRYASSANPNKFLNESEVSIVTITPKTGVDSNNPTLNSTVKIIAQSTLNPTVNTNGSTSLSVSAQYSGSDYLVYDWYVKKPNADFAKVQGGSFNSLLISNDDIKDIKTKTTWEIYCNVYPRKDASQAVHSKKFSLTINPVKEDLTISDLKISNSFIKPGETSTLSVSAKSNFGTSGLKYQWLVDKNGSGKFTAISGATQPTYTVLADETKNANGQEWVYCVQVTGSQGEYVLQSANLNLSISNNSGTISTPEVEAKKVNISSQSTNVTVETNNSTRLFVNAESTDKTQDLIYDWYVSKDSKKTWEKVQGGTLNTYEIGNVQIRDITEETTWNYYVNVYPRKDAASAVHSKLITLTIKPQSEQITIASLTSNKKELTAGVDTAQLSVTVNHNLVGSNRVKYQWMVSKDGFHWTNIQGATNPVLTINPTDTASVTTNTTWQYAVMVSGAKTAIQSDNLSINIKPKTSGSSESPSGAVSITGTSIHQTTAVVNSNFQPLNEYTNAKYTVSTKDSSATYQWYYTTKFGVNSGGVKIDGATSNVLKPNSELLKKAHELQSQGKTMYLYCNVYKNGKLAAIGSNSQFYLHVHVQNI